MVNGFQRRPKAQTMTPVPLQLARAEIAFRTARKDNVHTGVFPLPQGIDGP